MNNDPRPVISSNIDTEDARSKGNTAFRRAYLTGFRGNFVEGG